MNKNDFTKPFGRLIGLTNYTAFLPGPLPPAIKYDERLVGLISEASLQIGNLSGVGDFIPNPHLLIRPYLRKEAVVSSRIEGTQATIADIFRVEAGDVINRTEKENKRVDEVLNYVRALDECLGDISNGQRIDVQMIKKAHRILMTNVRGEEQEPGELRTVQNWIGEDKGKIEDATYVPPPPEHIDKLLTDLEHFIQNPVGRISPLVQCAIVHYCFEAIHPFRDGNGRIGRLLISIMLAEKGILEQPLLYLSSYIERNKTEYYALLLKVSQKSDWTSWIIFFLKGIITQAKEAFGNIKKMQSLKRKYKGKLDAKKASRVVTMIADYLFANPIISITQVAKELGVNYHSTQNAIKVLVAMEILIEGGNKRRGKLFVAYEILGILS